MTRISIATNSIYRSQNSSQAYKKYYDETGPSENCVFCGSKEPLPITGQLNLELFKVVANQFPYDFWDMKKVESHLIAIPNRHVNCIAKLKPEEMEELNRIMAHFSDAGYDVFARNSGSVVKTIEHLHMHLIKTDEVKLKVEVTFTALA